MYSVHVYSVRTTMYNLVPANLLLIIINILLFTGVFDDAPGPALLIRKSELVNTISDGGFIRLGFSFGVYRLVIILAIELGLFTKSTFGWYGKSADVYKPSSGTLS